MPKIETNGINLYYEVKGEGQPLILISGLSYGLWQWHKVVYGLSKHFKVVSFDNRGAGHTDKPEGPYSAAMLAADVAGLIKALDLAPAMVLGHSMGGFIAQEMALSYPELLSKVVLASTNFGGPNHIPVTTEALQVIMDRSGDLEAIIRRGVKIACAPGFTDANPDILQEIVDYRMTMPVPGKAYESQLAIGLSLATEEAAFESRLSNVTTPVVLLAGEHDKVVPPANNDLMAAKLRQSSQHVVPNTGHMFMLEAPEATVKLLVDVLK